MLCVSAPIEAIKPTEGRKRRCFDAHPREHPFRSSSFARPDDAPTATSVLDEAHAPLARQRAEKNGAKKIQYSESWRSHGSQLLHSSHTNWS
jgi:hypothetical protein